MKTGDESLPPGASRRRTPEQRRQQARLAANTRWSRPGARADQSEAARAAMWRRFEQQVDPEELLAPAERQMLAESAARAHSARMNLARSKSARPTGE